MGIFAVRGNKLLFFNTKMLEYVKTILLKVSFDKMLFEKELRKAFKVLVQEEIQQLKQWCYEKFSGMYLLILNKVFSKSASVTTA